MRSLSLTILPGNYSVCRRASHAPLEPWMTSGAFSTVSRTPTELSVVADSSLVPPGERCESDFALIRFEGQLPFELTGVLASVLKPLAAAEISVFAISTFDVDYVLLRRASLDRAAAVLRQAGHTVLGAQ